MLHFIFVAGDTVNDPNVIEFIKIVTLILMFFSLDFSDHLNIETYF